jgi:plastocyanin
LSLEVVMRLAIRALGLGLLAVSALAGCAGAATTPSASPTASPKPIAISIKGFAFNPATITVAKGTTVTWTNEDTVNHTVTTGTPPPTQAPAASGASPAPSASLSKGDGRIDSGRVDATKTFAFTFNEAGTFNYFCAVHPRMVATVTVQ